MPTWLWILVSIVGVIVAAFLLLVFAASAAIRRRKRAASDPSMDLGAKSWDADDESDLEAILATSELEDADEAPPPRHQVESLIEAGWSSVHRHLGSRDLLHDAALSFHRALLADPDNAGAWAGLADAAMSACYCHSEIYYRAGLRRVEPLIDRALACDADDQDARSVKALLRLRLGHVAEARALAEPLPADHWRANLVRSRVAQIEDETERAIAALERAVETCPDPRRSSLLNSLASLLDDAGKADASLRAYDRALELNPENPWAWHNRAVLLYRQQRVEEAFESSERALAIGEFGAARALNDRLRHQLKR